MEVMQETSTILPSPGHGSESRLDEVGIITENTGNTQQARQYLWRKNGVNVSGLKTFIRTEERGNKLIVSSAEDSL